ncbi:MAG: chromosomal replication initiator protein DnaA [Zoogloeaceae bacterium]|jgi:chromosomal replication initiator protein|nr:chromosomal replication initiator protein DnaA [Zoogloeaceae bacterium]
MSHFWNDCLVRLKGELPPQKFNLWIAPLELEGEDAPGGGLSLFAPSALVRDRVRKEYLAAIERQAAQFFGAAVTVQLFVREGAKADKAPKPAAVSAAARETGEPPAPKPRKAAGKAGENKDSGKAWEGSASYEHTRLNGAMRFESLVVGQANNLAYAAAQNVAEKPGGSYNPLFIYGGPGLGKTHLAHAIGNSVVEARPGARVRYVHAEDFCNDVMRAYRQGAFVDLKNYYRGLDILLLDDVQFLGMGDKSRTKDEFFFVFNALVDAGKQIVVTCDTYPKNVNGLGERLVSRFDSGLTVQIEPPETEMRVAILQKKAASERVSLPNEVAFFIAKSLRSNVRELEGALNRIMAYAAFRSAAITLELTREALKDLLHASRNISLEDIQKTIAEYYKVRLSDLLSKKRTRIVSRPRQVAMWLAKEVTAFSYPMIGESFGGRDHSTVIHAVRSIDELRKTDATLNGDLHVLTQMFRG